MVRTGAGGGGRARARSGRAGRTDARSGVVPVAVRRCRTCWSVPAGPAGLTAQRNSFEARHAVAELAAAHPDGAEAEQVGCAVERFLARSDVVAIPDESG